MADGVWAVLVAAGRGERLGDERPKAFARLGGLPLLAESLRRLDAHGRIDGIVLVCPVGWEEPSILLAEEVGVSKLSACVPGGETRGDSVRAGLAEFVHSLGQRGDILLNCLFQRAFQSNRTKRRTQLQAFGVCAIGQYQVRHL